jgi:hypothetical protein
LHIEYVRQAIDSAGVVLLSSPPAADAGARLHWVDAAMALQLAPLPHLNAALIEIARSVCPYELAALGHHREAPPSECVRLLAAAMWVAHPDCKKNASWVDIRKGALADAESFVQRLCDWQPVKDCTCPASLNRARDLLTEAWGWVANGCGGNRTLCVLFAWVSFAVSMRPLIEMAQLLAPVHRQVKRGLDKIRRASPEQQLQAKAKAWTAALFLLDGPGEPWWWLRLIRPAAEREPPWTDSVDGGLGARAPVSLGEEPNAGEGGGGSRQQRSAFPTTNSLATVGSGGAGLTEPDEEATFEDEDLQGSLLGFGADQKAAGGGMEGCPEDPEAAKDDQEVPGGIAEGPPPAAASSDGPAQSAEEPGSPKAQDIAANAIKLMGK